ncbi:MAG: DNA internalization-related competence protein ComEC/Rec2 [Mariprofundaceae bacterium]
MAIARLDAISFSVLMISAGLFVILLFTSHFKSLAMMALLGICWGSAALFWDASRMLVDSSWLQSKQNIVATVESVRMTSSLKRLRLSHIQRDDGVRLSGLIDVYQYGKRQMPIQPGQTIELTVSLHPPHNKLNPGAFDYWAYCFDRHIALIGSVRGDINMVDIEVSWLENIRGRIRQALETLPQQQRGVLKALILADRGDLDLDVEEAFSASGAAHLLAISGLHIGMVAAWAFAILWWLLTRREVWIVNLPIRTFSLFAGVLCTVIYATVAGWPLPTQRAVLMLVAAVLAWTIRARAEPINTMLAALVLIIFIDPSSVTSISLWLSFSAVTALLLWAGVNDSGEKSAMQWVFAMLWVSLIASLATLPMIADVFGRLPVYTLIANFILLPLYAFVVLPLALLGAFMASVSMESWAMVLMSWAGKSVSVGNDVLLIIHTWPAGNLWVPDVPLWLGIIYGIGMSAAGFLLWRTRYVFATSVAVLTLSFYVVIAVQEEVQATATQLMAWDVGQGASATLTMPTGQVLVVDVPGRRGSKFNGGPIVASGLREQGLVHADVLVLSHAQSDHAGGASRLLDHLRGISELWLADVPVNHVYQPMQKVISRIHQAGGMVRWLKRGDDFSWGDANIEVLWPEQGAEPSNDNNTSLVLSVRLSDGQTILFPGDIEAVTELAIVRKGIKPHDVLLMPHHGSKTSSTKTFVDAISAGLIVAQTGFHNHYGFPLPHIVKRYQQHDGKVLNTANGAVQIDFEGGEMHVSQYLSKPTKRETALQWLNRAL